MEKCTFLPLTNIAGKKWTFAILQQIALNNTLSFNVVHKKILRITPKILSQRLQELEKNQLIKKREKNTSRRTSYSLTQRGKEFYEILISMRKWNEKYLPIKQQCNNRECASCPNLN
ncbi:MAG TPA: helix-turn-helix domain-containing protein [Candidatus Nanoarchaeia archaeon]|nr:helix-turn-helix domain-containing protein [Candidatus Nanoarchaeia archaeon]